jgi:hypothetical protein
MKNRFVLFLLALAMLPTGCASVSESPYLTPTAITTSFDNVTVRTSEGKLLVTLESGRYNMGHLRDVHATSSNYSKITPLSLSGSVFHPENPTQIELVFVPAPQPPFNINIIAKADDHTLRLRADYYGARAITY